MISDKFDHQDIDLEKLIDFKGNRYTLAKACSEYAKKARGLYPDEYESINNKDSVLALSHVLDHKISYSLEKSKFEDDDLDRESILFNSKVSNENEEVESKDPATEEKL